MTQEELKEKYGKTTNATKPQSKAATKPQAKPATKPKGKVVKPVVSPSANTTQTAKPQPPVIDATTKE